MIPLFTEHLWPWVGIALFLASVGGIFFSQSGNLKLLLIWAGAAFFFLIAGAGSVYLIKTDRKEIRKTVFTIADSFERNDLQTVLNLIDPREGKKISRTVQTIDDVTFETANITDYTLLRIDRESRPPKAYAVLNGSVRGSVSVSEFAGPFLQIIHFQSIELVKSSEDSRWRVTDNVLFSCPGVEGGDGLFFE